MRGFKTSKRLRRLEIVEIWRGMSLVVGLMENGSIQCRHWESCIFQRLVHEIKPFHFRCLASVPAKHSFNINIDAQLRPSISCMVYSIMVVMIEQ